MSVKKLFDLAGRAAIVTGGSRGLGLQIAEALGEMGARLALTARKQDELDHAVEHSPITASQRRPTLRHRQADASRRLDRMCAAAASTSRQQRRRGLGRTANTSARQPG